MTLHIECGFDAYLELVLASLSGWGWVEKIDGENLKKDDVSTVYTLKSEYHIK